MGGRHQPRPRARRGRIRHCRSGWTGRTGAVPRLARHGDGVMSNLIEMYGVPDTFCEGLARIDQLGPCRRLTFMVRDIQGGRAIVAKLILPAEALAELVQMIAADIHVPKARASLSPNALANLRGKP